MPSSRSPLWLKRSPGWHKVSCIHQCRNASLTSAIERGIRTGKRGTETAERKRYDRPFETSGRQDFRGERTNERSPRDYQHYTRPERKEYNQEDGTEARLETGGTTKPWLSTNRYRGGSREEKDSPSRDPEDGGDRYHNNRRANFYQDSQVTIKDSRDRGSYERSAGPRDFKRKDFSNDREGRSGYSRDRRSNDASSTSFERREYTPRNRQDDRSGRPRKPWERADDVGRVRPRATDRDAGNSERDNGRSFGHTKPSVNAPLSIPYTTAGSEFVYGTFAVKAAIQSGRRTLHKLYVYRGEEPEGEKSTPRDESIPKLALAAGVRVQDVSGEWNRLLSKMTASRPHNGFVLEASPIPKLPITALQATERSDEHFRVDLAHQSEEELVVNKCFAIEGDEASIPREDTSRFPLVLLLDRILDPGNLGAIIRSAHFLGADGLIVVDHGTSPFSSVTVKASAGAAESFPVLIVKKEHQFIKASQDNGWKFFAATSPDSVSAVSRSGSGKLDFPVASALKDHPCVLMLGNEGEGLRPQLQRLADGVASIENARGSEKGVESLNVSVAAALLIQDFLKGSRQVRKELEAASLADGNEESLF